MTAPTRGKLKDSFEDSATENPALPGGIAETTDRIPRVRVRAEGKWCKVISRNPQDTHVAVAFGGQNRTYGKHVSIGVSSDQRAVLQIAWRLGDVITGNCRAIARDDKPAGQIQVLVGALITSVAPAHAQMTGPRPRSQLFMIKR